MLYFFIRWVTNPCALCRRSFLSLKSKHITLIFFLFQVSCLQFQILSSIHLWFLWTKNLYSPDGDSHHHIFMCSMYLIPCCSRIFSFFLLGHTQMWEVFTSGSPQRALTQRSLLVLLCGPYRVPGAEPGSAVCKTRTLFSVLLF